MSEMCWAGRRAFFGGQWMRPCPFEGRHLIAASEDVDAPEIRLCDTHYSEVELAGLVSEPNPSPERVRRWERRRAARQN